MKEIRMTQAAISRADEIELQMGTRRTLVNILTIEKQHKRIYK